MSGPPVPHRDHAGRPVRERVERTPVEPDCRPDSVPRTPPLLPAKRPRGVGAWLAALGAAALLGSRCWPPDAARATLALTLATASALLLHDATSDGRRLFEATRQVSLGGG